MTTGGATARLVQRATITNLDTEAANSAKGQTLPLMQTTKYPEGNMSSMTTLGSILTFNVKLLMTESGRKSSSSTFTAHVRSQWKNIRLRPLIGVPDCGAVLGTKKSAPLRLK
jgi:hypothetical protein